MGTCSLQGTHVRTKAESNDYEERNPKQGNATRGISE
jgi:hypothetical protein